MATVNTAAHILKVARHLVQCCSFYNEKVKICAMVYSNEEHVFITEHYFRTTSLKQIQELLRNGFSNCKMPNKSTIQCTVEHFRTRFSVAAGYVGWQQTPTMLAPEKIMLKRDCICDGPTLSTHCLSSQVGVSTHSVRAILKHLHLQPYKTEVPQELKPPDYAKCLHYCQWLRHFVDAHEQEVFNHTWCKKSCFCFPFSNPNKYLDSRSSYICSEKGHIPAKNRLEFQKYYLGLLIKNFKIVETDRPNLWRNHCYGCTT